MEADDDDEDDKIEGRLASVDWLICEDGRRKLNFMKIENVEDVFVKLVVKLMNISKVD
jgi:hypothetical protein